MSENPSFSPGIEALYYLPKSMDYCGYSSGCAPGLCPLAMAGSCCKGFSLFLQGGSVPQCSSQPHLCPELGQVTLRRNLLFVQAFNHVEVLSACVFGD